MKGIRSAISRCGMTAVSLGVGALLVWSLTGSAQQNDGAGSVRSMNNELLQLYAELQSSPGGGVGAMRQQAAALIEQRVSALASLIEQDPAEALRLAFPADVVSDLASAFPGARRQLETHGTWEGPIEYIIEDGPDYKTHRNIRAMATGGETLFVQFAGSEPSGLKNGDILRVEGVRAGNQIAASNGVTSQAAGGRPPKPPACTVFGPQNSIVLMVTMPGAELPNIAQSDVWDMFFNTGGVLLSLTDFWRENSYGATTAVGAIAPGTSGGWYTLDQVYTKDQLPQIRTAAIAAADPDVDFRLYTRLHIIVNGMDPITSGGGWGTLACGSLSSADGTFNTSTSWMRAPSFTENIRGAHLIIHEAGHNIGLQHSNSRDFDTEALGAPGAAGFVEEYDDVFAEMGRSFGHYAAPHKFKLGWLTTQVLTVTSSGSYSVQPTETVGSVQALRIRRGTDNANWLWVEYRQPATIYDSKLAAPFVFGLPPNQTVYLDAAESHIYSGGLIHYEDATTGSYTHLLDFTPLSLTGSNNPLVPDDWLDPVLFGSWQDTYTGLTITTSNPTASSLTVDVTYGTGPCVESNPTVTISPANPSAKRGQNVTQTVTVTNNDTLSCFSKSFDLTSSLPSGWSTTFSQNPAVISGGSSVAVSMTKTVPSDAAFATYTVDATATSGTYSGSGSASVTVKPGK